MIPQGYRQFACSKIAQEFTTELERAHQIHGDFANDEQAFLVLLEEVLEVGEALLTDCRGNARNELVQVGAMAMKCIRFLDKHQGKDIRGVTPALRFNARHLLSECRKLLGDER